MLRAQSHLQLADVVNGLQQERRLVELVAVWNEVPQLVEPECSCNNRFHTPCSNESQRALNPVPCCVLAGKDAPFVDAVAAALLRGHVVLHVGALASPP